MLTKKQQNVFDYIETFMKQHGYGPTVREVQLGLGYKSSSTIHGFMTQLEEKGYIERIQSSPRALKILKSG